MIIKFSITGIEIGREILKGTYHGNFVAYIKAWWSRGTSPRDFHEKKKLFRPVYFNTWRTMSQLCFHLD